MKARILLLPGDGVGPEVVAEGRRVLEAVARLYGHEFALVEGLIGRMALDAMGAALPPETVAACRVCDAALLGAVAASVQDAGRQLCLSCNLYSSFLPVRTHPALHRLAPLRPDLLVGVDLLLVRDRAAVGGWGGPQAGGDAATGEAYRWPSDPQLRRVIRAAFRAADRRRGRLTAVGPADRRLSNDHWRSLIDDVADGHPDVALEHVEPAICETRLDERPARLDVILACGPGHGAIHRRLADLAGSPGLLPSASLGDGTFGIYEPGHGAAIGIAGGRRANPTAALLSTALLLRHSFELELEARAVEQAVHDTLAAGQHTADVAGDPSHIFTTGAFTDAVLERLAEGVARAGGRA